MANSKPLPAPNDWIWVEARHYSWGVCVEYRGPRLVALQAAGCITEFMIDRMNVRNGRFDADGDRFSRKRCPTKFLPDRCYVTRFIDRSRRAKAQALPGVADYLDDQQQREPHSRSQIAALRLAQTMGVTREERTRAVGRFQRAVRWVTAGDLIVPDWPTIRGGAGGAS